jgi:hypothetical protein
MGTAAVGTDAMRCAIALRGALLGASLFLIFGNMTALADNCGDPSDCQTVPSNIATATGFAAGAAAVALAVAMTQERRKKKSWLEIVLRDQDGDPVPGERYQIQLDDGTVEEGVLDGSGTARVDGIEEGTCLVCFPDIDASEWRPA